MPARTPPPQVHKFGGASLADAAAMRHAVTLIRGLPRGPAVVVVSAMAGVTDALLGLARDAAAGGPPDGRALAALRTRHELALQALLPAAARRPVQALLDAELGELGTLLEGLRIVRELTPRLADTIAARGERMSARLIAAALDSAGTAARYVEATELIVTDGVFGGASPDFAATERRARAVLAPLLRRGLLPVVPGFLGAGPGGEVVTLGRGGSDLTATLLARALRAREVSLWKDVPGFLTADPRVVPEARVLEALHAREAAELAYYGAKVLHPRALTPLRARGTAVRVRPFADPARAGTLVSERRARTRSPVRAVSAVGGQALITVSGSGLLGVPDVAARTFAVLDEAALPVAFVTQASSEHSITFAVPGDRAEAAQHLLRRAFRDAIGRHEIDDVRLERGMAAVAVVGLGMAGARGVAARVFGALAEAGVNIVAIAQGSSELNISCVVAERDAATAQRAIHDAFQMGRAGGGAVLPARRLDVALLGFGQVGRELTRQLPAAAARGRPVRVVAVIDRAGAVVAPDGLSARRLAALRRHKARGGSLADAPGGSPGAPADAIAQLAGIALESPVLVDVTADDTYALLARGAEAGMHLVLANKRPLTERRGQADALAAAVAARRRALRFEATAGAGLPVMDTLRKLEEAGDRIRRIEGCLSGTLGFLLDEVSRGRRFAAALREALRRGYTEPDPRDDLSGTDVARKALILGRLIGFRGGLEDVRVESLVPQAARSVTRDAFLAGLEAHDPAWQARADAARAAGRVLRYVAEITPRRLAVGLREVDAAGPFGALAGTDNLFRFTTDRYRAHPLVILGPGAGLDVTAAGVLNDILSLVPA